LVAAHVKHLQLRQRRELGAQRAQGVAAEVELQEVAQGRQHGLVAGGGARQAIARQVQVAAGGIQRQHTRDQGSVQAPGRRRGRGHGQ
jgi:hypothetical protein